ncbi:hypothetical protein WPG_0310 [Winogradskyella sp. PG-2]|nr:hypothetical protein WPG_0310 [Winogradskyella sp. PG-2]
MLVLVVAVTFSSVLSASTNPNEKAEPASISKSIGDLLQNPNFQLDETINAMVKIFINEENEIVVLSVDTDNKTVESFIKSRLNYKKLSKKAVGYSKSFKVPVKMVKSK